MHAMQTTENSLFSLKYYLHMDLHTHDYTCLEKILKLLKTPRVTQQTTNSKCLETIVLFASVALRNKNHPL